MPTPPPAPGQTMTNGHSGETVLETDRLRISILLPEDWKAKDIPSGNPYTADVAYMAVGSPGCNVLMQILCTPYDAAAGPQDPELWKDLVNDKDMQAIMNDMGFLKNAKVEDKGWTELNGNIAYYQIMSGQSYDPEIGKLMPAKTLKRVFYLLPGEYYLAEIYYEATPDAYNNYKDTELDDILQSVTIEVK